MKEVDYIIVGLGIAGLSICEVLQAQGKSFVVYDTSQYSSTLVAAGVIHPMVLKRFTPVWKAHEHIHIAIPFYHRLAQKLETNIIEEIPLLRIFNSVEEQNNWIVASDKHELSSFLSSEIHTNHNEHIVSSFGLGKVNISAKVDTTMLLSAYAEYLQKDGLLFSEVFDYSLLKETEQGVNYNSISARKIIFSEGASIIANPFFQKDLLIPIKGEYIIIEALELKMIEILKGTTFMIPLGNDRYKVGATLDRIDVSRGITEEARVKLILDVSKMIRCPFKVVDQVAGIRPTTKDRRPLLGCLPESDKKIFFNGLGARGIMAAPSFAMRLFDFFEGNQALDKEINLLRFLKS